MKITIEKTDRNEFTVESGSRKAEGLTTDEALGLCAALLLKSAGSYMFKWMKSTKLRVFKEMLFDSSEWTDEMRMQARKKLEELGYVLEELGYVKAPTNNVGRKSIRAYKDGVYALYENITIDEFGTAKGSKRLTFEELMKL